MKRRMAFIVLLVFSQLTAYGQDSKVEQDLRKLDAQRIAALIQSDFPTLERMMTDDFTYTHSSGQTQNKTDFIGDFKSGKRVWKSLKETDIQVRVYGPAAIVSGRCDLTGVNEGKDFVLPMHFIEVYVNNNGNWRWLTWQSTRLGP